MQTPDHSPAAPITLEALLRVERALAIAASHTPWTVEEWEQLRAAHADVKEALEDAE